MDESDSQSPLQTAEPVEEKPKKVSKYKRWRQIKKERKAQRKAERKAYYAEAPALVRAWHLWIKKPLIIILVVALLGGYAFYYFELYDVMVWKSVEEDMRNPVDPDIIYGQSPIDEEGAARIDAMAPYAENETWGIYVYMVGADLEDQNQNDLSTLTRELTSSAREENQSERNDQTSDYLLTFAQELRTQGLDLPEYFFQPEVPSEAYSYYVTEDVVLAEETGAATEDIGEMVSGLWSDNIRLVIQTGGATHWSDSMMNPNKTQRFVYHSGQFSEVANLPLQDSCSPETLSDFLTFCNASYPADHTMVILWDHGSGVKGYGYDSIFSSSFTLAELKDAFAAAYTPNTGKPPIDILGFDACLMATAEVADTLDGFAKYLVASEELEPGFGWDYGAWLQTMTDNPTMNAAQVGRAIVDSFTDFYMTMNENVGDYYGIQEVTLSLLDMHQSAEAYRAYRDLCSAQLRDAADDLGVLSEMGRIAGKATRFGSYVYDEVNSIDLGEYMELITVSYPKEAQRVRALLKEAVIYHRQNGSLSNAQGLAVHVPVETGSVSGLQSGLEFVYDISPYEDVTALYYYKMAGCLNEEMQARVEERTGVTPKKLDVSPFQNFSRTTPAMEDGFWSVAVSDELLDMIQSATLEVALYENDCVTYYGRDGYVVADENGNLVSEFAGQWIGLDGVPLPVEVVSVTESAISYRSKVRCDGMDYYLMFSYNRDTDAFTLGGLKEIQTGDDTVLMLNTKQLETALVGKEITPIYAVHDFTDDSDYDISGETIKIKPNSRVSLMDLPEGRYLSALVISDCRGDSYYSAVVEQQVAGGSITSQQVNFDFYASN